MSIRELWEWVGAESHVMATIAQWAPLAAGLLLTAIVGLLAALFSRWLVRVLVRRTGFDVLAERLGVVRLLYAVNIKAGVDTVLGNIAGIAVLLVTAMVMAESVSLPGVAEGFAALVEFLPRFVTAAVVAGAGFLAADLGAHLAERLSTQRKDWVAPRLARNLVYYIVLAVFLTTSVQHLGLDTDLVDGLILLCAGIGLASVGLAFALGSRSVVHGLLVRQYVPFVVRPGDRVRIGEVSGVLVRYDAITLLLKDDHGNQHVFPCGALLREEGVEVRPVPTGSTGRREEAESGPAKAAE